MQTFTSGVTNRTNPVPVAKGSSGGFSWRRRAFVRVCLRLCRLCLRLRGRWPVDLSLDSCVRSFTGAECLKGFSIKNPRSVILNPGLYHYRREHADEKSRIHLRLDPDGHGTLIVNANRILHLNPTAALMAYFILERFLSRRRCA